MLARKTVKKSSKNLRIRPGIAPARGKLTAKLLLLEGCFNQTPGAPYAKTASGPADQQIRMANRPDRHHATANQRPGSADLAAYSSDDRKCLFPPAIHDDWRKDSSRCCWIWLSSCALRRSRSTLLLMRLLLEQLPIVCCSSWRVWRSNVDLRDLRNVQILLISASSSNTTVVAIIAFRRYCGSTAQIISTIRLIRPNATKASSGPASVKVERD